MEANMNKVIEEFLTVKEQIEELTEQNEVRKAKIKKWMQSKGLKKYSTPDGINSTLSTSESYKYQDLNALATLLKQDEDLKRFVIQSVDTKGLTELVKKSESVATKLSGKYRIDESLSLKVSR